MCRSLLAVLTLLGTAAFLTSCGKPAEEDASHKETASSAVTIVSEEKAESTVSAEEPSSEEPSSAAEDTSSASEAVFENSVQDLFLSADNREICIGEDDNEVIFVARDIIEPQEVELIDEDTGKAVGTMLDDADFEHSGDDIMGDAWYSLRYRVDDTFPKDPDVSEDKEYHFYARYIEDGTEHRSDTLKITVFETFTDAELDRMESVRNAVADVMKSDGFSELDIEGRKEKVIAALSELEEQGLVDKGSIMANNDMISYSVNGITSGVMVKPFDPRMK